MPFERDFVWQRRFLPELKRIIGEYFISEATLEEDTQHATDLFVLALAPIRIGCRVREFKYVEKYGDQFTLRSRRPSGSKTELRKILSGWGDYLLYAFADPSEYALWSWTIIRLMVFREWHSDYLARHHGEIPGIPCTNADGVSFRAYRLSEMPHGAIVARRAPGCRGTLAAIP